MNPINTSLAGTSVAPRSPRAPRSPNIQSRISPRERRNYQLNVQSYGKAENGQLTSGVSKTQNMAKSDDAKGKSETAQTCTRAKKNVKRCLIMWMESKSIHLMKTL